MIKKIILCLVVMVVFSSCSFNNEDKTKKETIQVDQDKDYIDPYLDENPIKLGIYINNGGSRNLLTNYDSDMAQYKDIVSLEVYYTRDENLIGNQKALWNSYYQNYQDIDKYKIGYYISFKVGNEEINKMILKPSDVDSIFNYIQVYLYDDINQGDGYYDHITDGEMNDNTILSSIKLTASTNIGEVVGPVKVGVFTYDDDNDFDNDGMYRGKSYYEVIINKK